MISKGPSCGAKCKTAYEIEGNEAPCYTCMPEIMTNNRDAWLVYNRVQTQVITAGMDGVIIGINILAIEYMMNMMNVTDKRTCFDKVMIIFNEIQALRKAMAEK